MRVRVYHGKALAAYGFGHGHPFGPDRLNAFWQEMTRRGLDWQCDVGTPVACTEEDLALFHSADYIARVKRQSQSGEGYLDDGDTPAFPGVFEAASVVVGSVLDGLNNILAGNCRRVFVPIAGLHHARRDGAAGFCVFNDIGVLIEVLRQRHGIRRVAYVDIDAHHGDGVFYGFESDPDLIFADIHEDGRYLYPGTGAADETGKGTAKGTKLIILQAGADSIAGDPITHMQYTPAAHAHATTRLCALADELCQGRILATGGGGYDRANLAAAWTRVVEAMLVA
jgi:acetoin utilization protein AcuC